MKCKLHYSHVTSKQACPVQVFVKQAGVFQDAVMASGLCENCSRLLKEVAAYLRKVCREFQQKIRDIFRELSQCTCFRTTPERNFLRRTTQELHLLYGRNIVAMHYLCLWGKTHLYAHNLFFSQEPKITQLIYFRSVTDVESLI